MEYGGGKCGVVIFMVRAAKIQLLTRFIILRQMMCMRVVIFSPLTSTAGFMMMISSFKKY